MELPRVLYDPSINTSKEEHINSRISCNSIRPLLKNPFVSHAHRTHKFESPSSKISAQALIPLLSLSLSLFETPTFEAET